MAEVSGMFFLKQLSEVSKQESNTSFRAVQVENSDLSWQKI
jgi:hypothetical protein